MKEAHIENVMALRGDIPEAMLGDDRSKWDYRYAIDLVRELKAEGSFCIGGACYPEIHPESPDQRADIEYLKEKVDAGCDFLTTQMFFDNDIYYEGVYISLNLIDIINNFIFSIYISCNIYSRTNNKLITFIYFFLYIVIIKDLPP